jgi:DNA-binding NtrC family response regulator
MSEKLADIVVVDADEQTRHAEEAWLKDQGYCGAVCVASGGAALRFLDAYRPKFAVLDVTTMGHDGLNVLEAVRRDARLRGLALVVHVAVPEAGAGDADGATDATEFRSQAYLTNGIDWPGMRAEMERYAN